jgi:dTDP-4-dehydrorhamnose 3,5-epimerase
MIFVEQKIKGVWIINPTPFEDGRGLFRRHFCNEEFLKNNIEINISQSNVSENKYKKTLRGFHYQLAPNQEAKTLSCFKGSIFDIVVDLREDSPTYKKWISAELTEKNRSMIHVPKGCANAFMTLDDNSIIHYYCSNPYAPESEKGIRYNDPSFDFKWPYEPQIISQKDLSHPDYQ